MALYFIRNKVGHIVDLVEEKDLKVKEIFHTIFDRYNSHELVEIEVVEQMIDIIKNNIKTWESVGNKKQVNREQIKLDFLTNLRDNIYI